MSAPRPILGIRIAGGHEPVVYERIERKFKSVLRELSDIDSVREEFRDFIDSEEFVQFLSAAMVTKPKKENQ